MNWYAIKFKGKRLRFSATVLDNGEVNIHNVFLVAKNGEQQALMVELLEVSEVEALKTWATLKHEFIPAWR